MSDHGFHKAHDREMERLSGVLMQEIKEYLTPDQQKIAFIPVFVHHWLENDLNPTKALRVMYPLISDSEAQRKGGGLVRTIINSQTFGEIYHQVGASMFVFKGLLNIVDRSFSEQNKLKALELLVKAGANKNDRLPNNPIEEKTTVLEYLAEAVCQ